MENYVPYERHPVEDCYHIYSDGTRVSVLFERDEDKVYGRNLIAVLAFKYHIRVYCDVVMGTHFHLVGKGDPENIHRFVAEMKRLLTRYFRQTHRPELVKESIWIKADTILDDVELARSTCQPAACGLRTLPLFCATTPSRRTKPPVQRDNPLVGLRRFPSWGLGDSPRVALTIPRVWL